MSHSQDESSEEIIGEWMERRGNRERLVIATKVHCALILFLLECLLK